MTKVCVFSDTHCNHKDLTIGHCDILVCCGDFSKRGSKESVEDFAKWLEKTPSKIRIVIGGNHDLEFVQNFHERREWLFKNCSNLIFLNNETIEVFGIRIHGCCYNDYEYWKSNYDLIKERLGNAHMFITHQPPSGILDSKYDGLQGNPLIKELILNSKTLKWSCFGHAHLHYGMELHQDKLFINSAVCDIDRIITKPPIYFVATI